MSTTIQQLVEWYGEKQEDVRQAQYLLRRAQEELRECEVNAVQTLVDRGMSDFLQPNWARLRKAAR